MRNSLIKWGACCLAILPCPALAAEGETQTAAAAADSELAAQWGALWNVADKDLACTCDDDFVQFLRWDTPGEVLRQIDHDERRTFVMAFFLWPDGRRTVDRYVVEVGTDGSLTPRPTHTPVSLSAARPAPARQRPACGWCARGTGARMS